MPVDAAGHGPPPRPPRAGPGAGEAGDPAAPAWAGDNTRSGGTGELAAPADPARSPVPDPGRRTAPRIAGIVRPLALPTMRGWGHQTLTPGPWTRSVIHF